MALDMKQVGAFHKNHGANIQLLEEGTVAHRKDSYNKAVVFTEYPINIGGLFEVKIEDIGGGWAGSLVREFVRIIFCIANNFNLCATVKLINFVLANYSHVI